MATTISPSAAILQDIVQNQGQELLRARRELEEAETSKASLGQKLAVAQEELRRLYETAPTETSTLADKNAPDIVYAATHAQLILSANPTNSLTLSDIHLQDVISTTVPTQSSASMNTTEETDHESSAPQTRSTSPESSLQPFCRRQSPFKITTMAKKLLGKGTSLLITTESDFIFDHTVEDIGSRGFLMKATQQYDRSGQLASNDRWLKLKHQPQNLISCNRGDWYYLGTYMEVSSVLLDAVAFEQLPGNAKKSVYTQTVGGASVDKSRVAALYAAGEIHVARIDFERTGFRPEVEEALFDAAARLGARETASN